MKKTINMWLAALLCGAMLTSCGGAPVGDKETESERHRHEYHHEKTVEGTCAELGYQLYTCACGDTFKSLIPSEHDYELVNTKADGVEYVKRTCKVCGDSSVARLQTYLFNIGFEDADTVEEAGNQPPNVEYYGHAGTLAEIVKNDDGAFAHLVSSNYYLLDLSNTLRDGKNFVLSFDVRFDKFSGGALFSLIPFRNGSFSYNDGMMELDPSGNVTFCSTGDSAYNKAVKLSDKGYNNITVTGNMSTGLYDVYVNQTLVRKGISYQKAGNAEKIYIRYLDRDTGFDAAVDNLKLYAADLPEFLVEPNGLVFEKE